VGTQVTVDPRLEPRAFVFDRDAHIAGAADIYRRGHMIIVDDMQWDADFAILRSGLIKRWRPFKTAFESRKATPEVMREFNRLGAHATRLFHRVFPEFIAVGERRDSFRPMITGPEPLHFDTYLQEHSLVTSLTNVSEVPRVYNLGPTFEELVMHNAAEMRRVVKMCHGKLDDMSVQLRVPGRPPLSDAPRHRVELAPGSIWFFNAKTCSHEVVYGEGAAGFTWVVSNTGAETQRDLMRRLA
jgi:hypothetical protein